MLTFCPLKKNFPEVNLINKSNCANVKVKILFDLGSERRCISRRAQNVLNLMPLKFKILNINAFGSKHSKITTVQ